MIGTGWRKRKGGLCGDITAPCDEEHNPNSAEQRDGHLIGNPQPIRLTTTHYKRATHEEWTQKWFSEERVSE